MDIQVYKNMFERSPIGYTIHKIILDEKGEPCDYIF